MVDTCPDCGGEIVAVCTVIVEYLVVNDNEEEQSWNRKEIDDDSSTPLYFYCSACNLKWHCRNIPNENEFKLDENGQLIWLAYVC